VAVNVIIIPLTVTHISWPTSVEASYGNDTRCLSICLSLKLEGIEQVADSESAILFAVVCTIPKFWAFLC